MPGCWFFRFDPGRYPLTIWRSRLFAYFSAICVSRHHLSGGSLIPDSSLNTFPPGVSYEILSLVRSSGDRYWLH
jgi:hypothetical protein